MPGLKDKPRKLFKFDLEEDLIKSPKKAKETLELIDKRIQEIKQAITEGQKKEDVDKLGTLLHGYNALKKVLSRIKK